MAETKEDVASFNTANYEFFYSSKSPFSQWYKCKFKDSNGTIYSSAEKYMMYQKAKLFSDIETAGRILATDNQKEIKNLGRQVIGFNEKRWALAREEIVIAGNFLKFSQNPALLSQLFATGFKQLVEVSPYDSIWGIGLDEETARVTPSDQWRGMNLLGKCLTTLREKLRFRARMSENPTKSG